MDKGAEQKGRTQLSPIFQDGAVLQHGRPVTLFGTGEEPVRVTLLGKTYEARTEAGRFTVTLPPMPAGGPHELTVTLGERVQVLRDILFGEVVLLAGQSNAELPMRETDTAPEDYRTDGCVRVYFAAQDFGEGFRFPTPIDDRWVSPCEQLTPTIPALAYHLGIGIAEERDIPVGIVCVVRGASVIQSFMPASVQAHLVFSPEELSGAHPCNTTVARYRCYNTPGVIYHRMLEPLLPYTVSRVVWYQGESNTGQGESEAYDRLLAAMIAHWRQVLQCETLPFVIVKIHVHSDSPGWLAVQRAQERAARDIPHCTLVSLDSLGFDANIHPRDKAAVAARILPALQP